MQAPDERTGKGADHWERFWNATDAPQHEDAIRLPVLDPTWKSLLADLEFQRDDFLTIELACGSGSVSKHFKNKAQFTKATKIGVDASTNALKRLQHGELPVSGNLERLPFARGSVDLLTSQFGIEYAGVSSIEAALDCVAVLAILFSLCTSPTDPFLTSVEKIWPQSMLSQAPDLSTQRAHFYLPCGRRPQNLSSCCY